MCRFLSLLFAGILFLSSCKPLHEEDPMNEKVGIVNAAKDYRLFREILENAHPSLTEYISKKRLNFLFDSVYKTIDPPLTLRGFYTKLSFLVNEIGCSHTFTNLPGPVAESLFEKQLFFPFPVTYIEGALIANSDFVVPRGTRILSINAVPAKLVLDSMTMYNSVEGIHRETQRYLTCEDFSYDYFVRFGGFKKFELLVKDTSGYIHTISPEAISLDEARERDQKCFYFDATDVPYYLVIDDEFHYARMRLTTFEFESDNKQMAFENFLSNSFELLSKKPLINTLVIDLRENAGGDLFNCFLLNSYICHHPFAEYKSVSSKIGVIPYSEFLSADFDREVKKSINDRLKRDFIVHKNNGYQIPDTLIRKWTASTHPFLKQVMIVTNSSVASAASYFALLAKYTAGAKIVGVETAGGDYSTNGFAILKYTLPATGIGLRFPYANLSFTCGAEKPMRGIIPDYVVPDTYNSFKNNADQQINFITDSLIAK